VRAQVCAASCVLVGPGTAGAVAAKETRFAVLTRAAGGQPLPLPQAGRELVVEVTRAARAKPGVRAQRSMQPTLCRVEQTTGDRQHAA
jgi:hypothetical protein